MMKNNESKLGFFAAYSLMTFFITTKIFFTGISTIIDSLGTAAWYGTLISCATSIIFFSFLYLLIKRFRDKDIIEINDIVLGKFLGKFVSILFCVYSLYYAGTVLREFVEMIKAYNLPYTPPSVILLLFIAVVCIFTYIGIEGIGRISAIFFYPVLIGFIVLLVLASPNYVFDYIKPYGGYGVGNTFMTGFLRCSAYDEIFFLAVIFKSLQETSLFKKVGFASLLTAGVIFSVSILVSILTFEYTMGRENLSNIFQLSKTIYFSRYFQRVESIFLLIWVISSVINVMISFYCSISIYSKVFMIKNIKPLILPFAFLLFWISLFTPNLLEVTQINLLFINQYSMFLIFLVPIAILLIAMIRGKKDRSVKV